MVDFPGMNPSGPPLPSGDPVVPQSLINPQIIDKIRDAITGSQMQAMASQPGAENVMTRLVEKMLIEAAKKTMNQMDKTPAGHQRLSQMADRLAQADASLGTTAMSILGGGSTSAAPTGDLRAPTASSQPSPGASPTFATQTLRQQYQEGRQVTMGSLARRVSGALATSISANTSNWKQMEDGSLQQVLPDPSDPSGLGTIPDPNGRTVRPGDHDYESTVRTVARGKMLSNALGKISTGDPALAGRIGMLAGRAAGGVGIAVTAVSATGHFLEGQRREAASYRQAFGDEGTGMFAAKDRFGEFVAGLKGFGTIGGAQAREDYRAASALGLRGGRRDAATDFSRDMFMKFGMSGQDSMQIVQQALETGNVSLTQYAESIKRVTKAAVDGGRSAAAAVKDMVAAQGLLAGSASGGRTSLGIAANLGEAVAGMDTETAKAFGGAAGLAGTVTNQRAIMFGAAISGTDPLTGLLASQAPGQQGVQAAHNLLNNSSDYLINQIAQMAQMTPAAIRSDCKGVTAKDEQWQILTEKWAKGDARLAELMLQRMMAVLPTLGFKAPESAPAALSMFFSMASGGLTKGDDLAGGMKTSDKVGGHTDNYFGTGVKYDYHKVSGGVGSFEKEQENRAAFFSGGGTGGAAADDYLKLVGKQGYGSASIEGLLAGKGAKEVKAFTGGGVDDAKFIVKDKSGAKKTVSLQTIIKNPEYRAQLADGSAIIKGKGHEQESVSEITGVDVNGGSTGGSGSKDLPTTKVQVEFTGDAKRWLKQSGPTAAEKAGKPESGKADSSSMQNYGPS